MTIPHLMNCQHSEDGLCLGCVKELAAEREEAIRRGNNFYQVLVKKLEMFWPEGSRDLDYDVIPGCIATKLTTLASENERLRAELATRPQPMDVAELAELREFLKPRDFEIDGLGIRPASEITQLRKLVALIDAKAATIERQRAALLAIIKANGDWDAAFETGTSQEESDAVAKLDAALAAAARELEGKADG